MTAPTHDPAVLSLTPPPTRGVRRATGSLPRRGAAPSHRQRLAFSAPSRISVEPRLFLQLPMAPLTVTGRAAQTLAASGDRMRTLRGAGWELRYPGKPGEHLPSATVADVMSVLVYLWGMHGSPADGIVPFSRYGLLKMLGWVDTSGHPRGHHYETLRRCVRHLHELRYQIRGSDTPDPLHPGRTIDGLLSICLIDAIALEEGVTKSRGPSGSVLHGASWIRFSDSYLRCLAPTDDRHAPIDLAVLMRLSPGPANALWRVLTARRPANAQSVEVPVCELLARIGSTETNYVPSRVTRVLGSAHAELNALGLITRDVPEYVRRPAPGKGDEWVVRYEFARPMLEPAATTAQVALIRAAGEIGMAERVSRRLIAVDEPRFRSWLVALVEGRVTNVRNKASYLVSAIEGRYPPPEGKPPVLLSGTATPGGASRRSVAGDVPPLPGFPELVAP